MDNNKTSQDFINDYFTKLVVYDTPYTVEKDRPHNTYNCPRCGCSIMPMNTVIYQAYMPRYCDMCGQRLKWSI